MSETFLTALAALQAELPTLQKTAINPHFRSKYVPLDDLHEVVMPLLQKHGFIWTTQPSVWGDEPGEPALSYTLIHIATEERSSATMLLQPAKKDPQAQGSAITYARRYALMAVLGLVADEDDDGNAGSARQATPPPVSQPAPHKDDARPVAPLIPRDRAADILRRAVAIDMAKIDMDAAPGTPPEYHAVFKALLGTHGIAKIGQLNADTAEAIEAWLTSEEQSRATAGGAVA